MANVIFPRDTTNDIDNTKVAKPEYLYAYKDPNAGTPLYGWTQQGETLYAWHCATPSGFDEESAYYYPQTVYTDTPTPTSSSTLYDASGNVLTTRAESTTIAGNTLTQHYIGVQGSGGSNE